MALVRLVQLTVIGLVFGFTTPTEAEIIKIAGLFGKDTAEDLALREAVEYVNERTTESQLEAVTHQFQTWPDSSFATSKQVCELMEEGIGAVFGPSDAVIAESVYSICEVKAVPHFRTEWLVTNKLPYYAYSFNIMPHPDIMGTAYSQVVSKMKWERFTLLYQTSLGLARLQGVLQQTTERGLNVTVRHLVPHSSYNDLPDYIEVLMEARDHGEHQFLIDCEPEMIPIVLNLALMINMMSPDYHYVFTSLDLETIDLEYFSYGGANITGYRMVNPSDGFVEQMRTKWRNKEIMGHESPLKEKAVISTSAALVFDSVLMLAEALASWPVAPTRLSCSDNDFWDGGDTLGSQIKMLDPIRGLTGERVQLKEGFERTKFTLDLIDLTSTGLTKIGQFEEATEKLKLSKPDPPTVEDILKNKTLRVTTLMTAPFAMYKDDWEERKGNDKFEGFCVDMLEELSNFLGFNYSIHPVNDGKYGDNKNNGKWNGMVGELIEDKADLAVAPFTISLIRESAIDFTVPFMNLGISILYQKPEKQKPGLFAFLDPLKHEIWLYMMLAYTGLSFLMFVVARLSPYEWDNPHPCNQDSELEDNQFGLLNSFWFFIGSLMQQGSDLAPRAMSTRLIAGIWWFFTLIIISSYTANLAAFLTVERLAVSIESAEDLADQTLISYGCQEGGSTQSFFMNSKISTYGKMGAYMESASPTAYVSSSSDGIERAKHENYAFLMESVMIEYTVERECTLTQIGGLLDSKGYGIGVREDYPLRDWLSEGVLKLNEKQVLLRLKNKWWKEMYAGNCGAEESEGGDVNSLGMDNVGGCFLVLSIGVLVAVIIAFAEWIYFTCRHRSRLVQGSFSKTLADDFMFAINCFAPSERRVPPSPEASEASEMGDETGEPMYTRIPLGRDVLPSSKSTTDYSTGS